MAGCGWILLYMAVYCCRLVFMIVLRLPRLLRLLRNTTTRSTFAKRAQGTFLGTLHRDFTQGLCTGTLHRDFAQRFCSGTLLTLLFEPCRLFMMLWQVQRWVGPLDRLCVPGRPRTIPNHMLSDFGQSLDRFRIRLGGLFVDIGCILVCNSDPEVSIQALEKYGLQFG